MSSHNPGDARPSIPSQSPAPSDARALLSEIARLKAELADANEALTCAYMLGAEKAKDEIAALKDAVSTAEAATRKALESIPVAMDAAVAEAVEIIRPFAILSTLISDAADDIGMEPHSDEAAIGLIYPCGGDSEALEVGHFRAARAFVDKHTAAIRARASEAGHE